MRTRLTDYRRRGVLALTTLTMAAMLIAGCGKAGPAKPAAAASPTHAQLVAKADAICARTAKSIDPLIAQLTTIQNAGGASKSTRLHIGPLLEEIAGGNRLDGRQLMEIPVTSSQEQSALQNAAYTMLELSVMEEQLAQGYRTNEPSRIRVVAPDVQHTRAHALEQARQFGLKVCAQTPQAHIP